jgi:hypothetical protein
MLRLFLSPSALTRRLMTYSRVFLGHVWYCMCLQLFGLHAFMVLLKNCSEIMLTREDPAASVVK